MLCEYDHYFIKTTLQKTIGGIFTGAYILGGIALTRYANKKTKEFPHIWEDNPYLLLFLFAHLTYWSDIIYYIAPYLCLERETYYFLEAMPLVWGYLCVCMVAGKVAVVMEHYWNKRICHISKAIIWTLGGICSLAVIVGFFVCYHDDTTQDLNSFWRFTFIVVVVFGLTLCAFLWAVNVSHGKTLNWTICISALSAILVLRIIVAYLRGDSDFIEELNKMGKDRIAMVVSVGISVTCDIFLIVFLLALAGEVDKEIKENTEQEELIIVVDNNS